MMITAELASLYRIATEQQPLPQDDSLQPVVASATLGPRRPVLVPERNERDSPRAGRQDDASSESEIGELHYNRRQRDGQRTSGESGKSDDDRRKQALPTLIDTRLTRARRRTDRQETIDFEI